MTIIIGLGNPGIKYKKTRHNVGFLVLDEFRKAKGFPKFKFQKKFQADISEKDGVLLVKPQTFMNNSGQSISAITTNYLASPDLAQRDKLSGFARSRAARQTIWLRQISRSETNYIVVHDDLDIPLGEVKISQNKSAGGHKGVQSIINELGTQNFKRVRVGIQQDEKIKMKNEKRQSKIKKGGSFVLGKFNEEEKKILSLAIKKAGQALLELLAQK